jgi:predicted small lipoprotein YifL
MHCWARYLFIAVVFVLGIGQMIAACGQKGDLYLPEPDTSERNASGEKPGEAPLTRTGQQPADESEVTDVPETPALPSPAKSQQ